MTSPPAEGTSRTPRLSALRRSAKRPLVFCAFGTTLFIIFGLPSRLYAQWEYVQSYHYGYSLHSQQSEAFFFPPKDPEEQEITLGPLTVRPGLGVSETYSNNITLWKVDQKEDFITKAFPALLLHLPYRRHSFEVEYMGDFSWYAENSKYDANNHLVRGTAHVRSTKSLDLRLTQVFGILDTPTEDIPQEAETNPVFLDRRRGYNLYSTDVAVFYERGRSHLQVFYDLLANSYHETMDQGDDFLQHQPSIQVGYGLFEKTVLFVGYRFTDFLNSRPADQPSIQHTGHQALARVTIRFHQKLEGYLEGNYNWQDYVDIGGFEFVGANADLAYTPFTRLGLYLRYSRDSSPVFTYQAPGILGSGFYETDTVFLSLRYDFRYNLLLWCNFVFRNFRYPKEASTTGASRLDQEYGGLLQLAYRWRPWLRFSLIGAYTTLDSNLVEREFSEARGQFIVQAAF
jgi:hypothetical protein